MFFSIIASDYEGTVQPQILQRFLDSLKAQTYKNFEVIIIHDGPRSGDLSQIDCTGLKITFLESIFRGNSWGHTLRSYGMTKASGLFLLNSNTDNIYYPDALQKLVDSIMDHPSMSVFISNVKMMGMGCKEEKIPLNNNKFFIRKTVYYDKPRDYSKSHILTGNPPVFGNIDMMSLVASKDIWESINYWFDISESSDATVYTRICSTNSYHFTDILLGEHY